MYYELAHLYDWAGSLDFAETILRRDLALLETAGLTPPARLVDLACGTGTLALALAEKGYAVTGIELSEPMLEQARRKQATWDPQKKWPLSWQAGDMRHFVVEEPVDAVLCHYDSLNHLSNESELRATFLQAAQALRPGGLFIFDLNTLENYRTFWNGSDTDEGPNYRLKTQSGFDEPLGRAEVCFQVDEYTEDGILISRQERVVEHYFNETAVEKYLMAAEFYDTRWEPFNPVSEIPAEFPLKTYWHCRKRPA